MEDLLHKTFFRLENILGYEKWEIAKELAAFSADLSEINKKSDSLHVSADHNTDNNASLEGEVDRIKNGLTFIHRSVPAFLASLIV